jgi:dTDP-4-dehydrorhamnose reductase
MRVLITGGSGQLGRALQRALVDHDIVVPSRSEADLADPSSFRRFVSRVGLSMSDDGEQVLRGFGGRVINGGALTDTALCEDDPVLASNINTRAAGELARDAIAADASFIQISTNEVFDGQSRRAYQEADPTNAINAYGRSKLEGEKRALNMGANVSVIRTAWLFGEGNDNFVAKVIAAARAGKPLRFVTDEIATPTYVDDLAVAIRQLIEREAPPGIYHLTNEGEASRYEWACEILRLAGMSDVPVEPITTEQLYASGYDGPRKPPYSVLANTRARALGITMRDWREALADYFATYRVAAEA